MGKTKDDLISRQAAIKAIAENFGQILGAPPWMLTGAAERWMNEIPGKEAAPEWIPCSEAPPAGGDDYLVSFDDGFVSSTSYIYDDWELWADAGEPLAWMPLPAPYKPKNGFRCFDEKSERK